MENLTLCKKKKKEERRSQKKREWGRVVAHDPFLAGTATERVMYQVMTGKQETSCSVKCLFVPSSDILLPISLAMQ